MGDPGGEGEGDMGDGNGNGVGEPGNVAPNATQHGSGAGVQPLGVTGEVGFSQSPGPATPLRGRMEATGVAGDLAGILPGGRTSSIFAAAGVPPGYPGFTFAPTEGLGTAGAGRGRSRTGRDYQSPPPGPPSNTFGIGGGIFGNGGDEERSKRRIGATRDGSPTRVRDPAGDGGLGGMSGEFMEQMKIL